MSSRLAPSAGRPARSSQAGGDFAHSWRARAGQRRQHAHRAAHLPDPGVRRLPARGRHRLAAGRARRILRRLTDRPARRAAGPPPGAGHRLRQDRRPSGRQSPDRSRPDLPVRARRAALVGHRGDHVPRDRRDRAPVLGYPPWRDRGQPRRQAEDPSPGHRDLLVRAAAGAESAGGRARAGHGRGGCRHPGDRRRLCSASDATAPFRVGPGRVSRRHRRLGGKIVVVGSAGQDAYELAEQILARLSAGDRTVAVAESLTGGLVAAALTDVPGASASFRGGVVTYATELKASLLGVDRGMLARHGAVYAPVAAAMAAGVRTRLGATYGVATTGVAGPEPADGQPVGTAHIAVSAADDTVVRTVVLTGDRHLIRRLTVEHALGLLLGRLREDTD